LFIRVLFSPICQELLHLLLSLTILSSPSSFSTRPTFRSCPNTSSSMFLYPGLWAIQCNAPKITSGQFLPEFNVYVSFKSFYIQNPKYEIISHPLSGYRQVWLPCANVLSLPYTNLYTSIYNNTFLTVFILCIYI
jgi:hypothetical protein